MAEPLTLYKLIVLYMLEKVNFPLTNGQISAFILDQGYTTYFNLQQAINELLESDLIQCETIRNHSQYRITPSGSGTLEYFQNKISAAIRQDIDDYLKDHQLELRNEVAVTAEYFKNTGVKNARKFIRPLWKSFNNPNWFTGSIWICLVKKMGEYLIPVPDTPSSSVKMSPQPFPIRPPSSQCFPLRQNPCLFFSRKIRKHSFVRATMVFFADGTQLFPLEL